MYFAVESYHSHRVMRWHACISCMCIILINLTEEAFGKVVVQLKWQSLIWDYQYASLHVY